MIEIYAHEFKLASETLAAKMLSGDVKAGSAYYQAVLPLLELLQQVCSE